jgi:hypothetical protein
MENEFTALKEESVTMKNDIEEIKQQMTACKLLIQLIMGRTAS